MLWEMSNSEWVLSFGFIGCLTYMVGWFCDGILKHGGFGHFGNWLLLLIGAYGAMYGYNLYGYKIDINPLFSLSVISGVTCAFFLLACSVKRVFE
ncbi:MAG: hypothetical protein JJ891_01325 [Rhizobiaceae bacterium]|jgi:uncharacterized membrane protein YeaQ/YmgE (transglycosylase-associated protein family)|nr:hypothetical protein [Rhizobiaceae bacterium]